MKNILTLSISLIFGFTLLAQDNTTVDLNWKISPGDTLIYETIMEEIDTSIMDFNFGEMFESFAEILDDETLNDGDTIDMTKSAESIFKELKESTQNLELQSELSNNGNGIVEIVMKSIPTEQEEINDSDSTENEMDKILRSMQSMNNGIVLRGSVHETGDINSFWVKSHQKNLIALFFQLPSNSVKIGDNWKLDISLIANDQNFVCDSSYKMNKVTLTDIKTAEGETIAVLKYEIEEFVDGTFNSPIMFGADGPTKTMMTFKHDAIAEFSIDQGKWISYNGIMSSETTGFMTSSSTKRLSLIAK